MFTLLPLTVVTTSGSGGAVDVSPFKGLRGTLDVTAFSPGTAGAVVFTLETSRDGTAWRPVGAWPEVASEDEWETVFARLSKFVRVSWVAGDASAEVTVLGEGAAMYAGLPALYGVGLPKKVVDSIPHGQALEALASASAKVDAYLRARVTLPLLTHGDGALRRASAIIAAYDWLTANGYNPDDQSENFRLRYLDELKWLQAVADGDLPLPGGLDDSTPGLNEGAPDVSSDPLRGW